MDAATGNRCCQVLLVKVQGRSFAMDLSCIERVFLLMDLQTVPACPDYMAGLMNYHGQGLAVIDLGLWLGLPDASFYDETTPVVLCRHDSRRAAFVVGDVVGVESAPAAAMQTGGGLDTGRMPFCGVLDLAGGMALCLDMERILESVSGVGQGVANGHAAG